MMPLMFRRVAQTVVFDGLRFSEGTGLVRAAELFFNSAVCNLNENAAELCAERITLRPFI